MSVASDELASTDEVIIEQPLRFPWDSLPSPRTFAPITVRLAAESLLDLAALEPVFAQFLDGDRIEAADPMIERYLEQRYGLGRHGSVRERATAKAIARNRHAVLARLAHEAAERGDTYHYGLEEVPRSESTTTAVVSVDFAVEEHDLVGAIENLDHVSPDELIEVWGLRSAPGAPTTGALLAFRIEPSTP